MRVSVVGTGHAGLVTAACLAHVGHEVLGVDADPAKIAVIERGESPFHEPGLADLIREGLDGGGLRFSADVTEATGFGEVAFSCVGTPTMDSGAADLSQVESVGRSLARGLRGILAQRSTVPVGTGAWLAGLIGSEGGALEVASVPEFLREGKAVRDTLEPDRVVIGVASDRAARLLQQVFGPIVDRAGCPLVVTDVPTAELIKVASNAFLATKVSFINMVADICERTGANVERVADALGMDPRIGRGFLRAGLGYGGGCFPKDVSAFRYTAGEIGVDPGLLAEVERVNRARGEALVEKAREVTGGLRGRAVAVWGLAFKPDTDDMRESPATGVVRALALDGARVTVYDPAAMATAKELLPDVAYAADERGAARGAECLVICTEWERFASVDLDLLREVMARPAIVDGRNLFEPEAMAAAGFTYASMGRPTVGSFS